jgi:outer membrane protein OmpA-like peptidoglycan-associated protein
VKTAVALHFRNPYGQYAVGDSLMEPRHKQYFKDRARVPKGSSAPLPDTTGPTTKRPYTLTLHRGDRTIVGTVVMFAPNATDLDDAARDQLKEFVPRIHGKPQKVEIRGHALRRSSHSNPGKNEPDPWTLSYERCLSAMKYLIEQGIPADRLRLSQAGAFEPYTLGDQPDQVASNSRIEVYLLNEVAEDANGTPEERDQRYTSHGEVTKIDSNVMHGSEHKTSEKNQMTNAESPATKKETGHSH